MAISKELLDILACPLCKGPLVYRKDAQELVVAAQRPWQLIPGLFVVLVVLMFNFVGDGLRDALDPRLREA